MATSASASRNGWGMPARARSTSRSNPTCAGGRRPALRAPRRRFGMAAYRRRVASASDRRDEAIEPAGFVVVVPPGDRIHFLDWGGTVPPAIVLVHGLAGTGLAWAGVARRL